MIAARSCVRVDSNLLHTRGIFTASPEPTLMQVNTDPRPVRRRHGRTTRSATGMAPRAERDQARREPDKRNRTMKHGGPLITGVDLAGHARKSQWPARLDRAQSASD